MMEIDDKDVKTATINKYLKEHRNIRRKIKVTKIILEIKNTIPEMKS